MATSKIISADLPPNYVSLAMLRDRWIAEEEGKKKQIERQEVQLIETKSLALTKTEKESLSVVAETDCNREKKFAEVTNRKKNQAVKKIETKSLALAKADEESISAVPETDCNREKFAEGKKKKKWIKNDKNKKNRSSEADENATDDVTPNIVENKVRRSKISRKRGIGAEPGGCEKENVKKVGDVLVKDGSRRGRGSSRLMRPSCEISIKTGGVAELLPFISEKEGEKVWQMKSIPKRGQGDGTEDIAQKVAELSVRDGNLRGISPLTRHFGGNKGEIEGEAEKRTMPSEIKLKSVIGLEQGAGVSGNIGASYNGKRGWHSNKSIRNDKYYGRFGGWKERAQTYGVPIWVRKGEVAFGDAGAPIG